MKVRIDNSGRILCPVCRIPMDYAMETEKNNSGERRITRYYYCPACNTRVIDEQLLVKPEGDYIKVVVISNGSPVIIRRAPSRARRTRKIAG